MTFSCFVLGKISNVDIIITYSVTNLFISIATLTTIFETFPTH